jgi:seryl-tRNA synthetase
VDRLKSRDPGFSIDALALLDKKRKELIAEVESKKAEQNKANKEIGARKKAGDDPSDIYKKMKEISDGIKILDAELAEVQEELNRQIEVLPNIPAPDVPVSLDKSGNVKTATFGEFKRAEDWDFLFKNHLDVAMGLAPSGGLDFKRASKMTGANWSMYRGDLARLEWSLVMYFIDMATSDGRELIIPPYLVNSQSMFSSGQFPKFREQAYECRDDDLVLIPTSEVPLLNLYRDEILPDATLPMRLTSFTPCFRREAGTYGAEERGLIRVHQFHKVEVFSFTRPDESFSELEVMINYSRKVLESLELPYRLMKLATGDLAQQSATTFDIEAWLPGQNTFSEVSSVSNCTDYQARRANIRYRPGDQKKPEFVHTLNGSALATSRTMVSILEHYQEPDGGLRVPDILKPYMQGQERIEPLM